MNGNDLMPRLVAALIVLLMAPALPGIATRTRALLTGRRGAPVMQLYRDLRKLLGKGAVYSTTTTAMFRLAPVVLLATSLVALLLIPLDGRSAILSFAGDAVAFLYLLALGRFVLVLGAMDTGSSFEGMGASREVSIATYVEAGLFLSLVALAVATSRTDLSGMLGAPLAERWLSSAPAFLMVATSLFVLLLAENARVPVDDPATHLELTMVHEVMILDHGGPDLAMILYASSLKLALFASLVVSVLLPRSQFGPVASLGILAIGLALVAVLVGVVESATARLRMPKIPLFVVAASTAAGMAVLLLIT
jgi:formate hydrogenlyase subunit 4